MVTIRREQSEDYNYVRIINDRAFGQPQEGRIVDTLREVCETTVSLVAVMDDTLVGHIFFSPATIKTPSGTIVGMGLAPMAVLPEFQKQGVGSMLVREGLRIMKEMSYPFVIVLGHEHFYPRFGFRRASDYGLKSQWDGVPDEAFMALILDESAMIGVTGIAEYRREFDEAM